MDPPTDTTTAAGERAPAPAGDTTIEVLVVLTVHRGSGPGAGQYTHAQVATVSRRATRMDVVQWALSHLPQRLRDGGAPVVAFFSAEPNQLTTAAG